MSTLIRQVALLPCRTPATQFQRNRGKINIQRPQKPHYERARVVATTQPQVPEAPKTNTCFVRLHKPAVEENPYVNIIAREVRNWLQHSRMVAIFHLNSIKQDELFNVRVQLHKQNMVLKVYGKQIVAKAVTDTRFETILPLFEASSCVVFSPEQRVSQLLRVTRRVPQMILLGGIVEERLLSRNELVAYAQLPGLQAAQGELVQTLNAAAGNLVQQLQAHQNNFVNVLDVYAKASDAASEGKEATSEEKESTSEAAGQAPKEP